MTTEAQSTPSMEREFAETTTLHGVSRVFGATKTVFKIAWICIMLGCLGVCIWQISDRVRRFLEFKATTEISLEYVSSLNFPAVTVCNFNRYRISQINQSDVKFILYLLEANDYDYESYGDSLQDLSYAWQGDSGSFNYTAFTLRAGFTMANDTLIECEWRGKEDACSSANFSHVFTSYGNCWTFNSGLTRPVLKGSQAGSGNGLKLLIDVQQSEYTETSTGNLEAGLKVLVHDQETPASADSGGLAVPTGVHAFIGLKKQQIINLNPPYGQCNSSKTLSRYNANYTLEACNIECRAEAIVSNCGCRLVRHPGEEPECSPQQTAGCAKDILKKLKSGEIPSCNCPVPCNYTTFTTSLSTANLPSQIVAPSLIEKYQNYYPGLFNSSTGENATTTLTEEYIRNNWVLLDVYYEEINLQKFVQSEAITPSGLISDIGGQLGLFLGASFITLAEIISYFARKIEHICKINKDGKQSAIGPEQDRDNNDLALKEDSV